MAEFRMPSLGADMDAGTLVEWLKGPGDAIARGDIIAVVETQKGAIEIEVFQTGVVERLLVEPGATVPVGTPLAVLQTDDAAAEPRSPSTGPPAPAAPAIPVEPAAMPAATPAPSAAPPPSAPAAAPVRGTEARISPAARRIAADRGVSLAGVQGTGPEGAIVSSDVEKAATGGAPTAPASSEKKAPARKSGLDLVEMRKAIAAAMARSKREIPHYYLSHEIDAGDTLDWLAAYNAEQEPPHRLLLNVLLLKAVALALPAYPEFNGHFADGAFQPSEAVHVGTAIAIRGGGLVAPAIRETDTKPLDELMAGLRDLVARARAGRLRGSELFDPTVTVSSLGERGVDSLYGVIYPPQVALIGFGAPRPRPRVIDGVLAERPAVTVTLAADHRASDGHRGALLLREIERLLQHPEEL